jgi:hypothetical protein
MLRMVRQMVIWALVAVIACGNGLSLAATANDHIEEDFSHVANAVGAVHHHKHTSNLGDSSSSARRQLQASEIGNCNQMSCVPDEAPSEPCCHMHAHCCVTLIVLTAANNEAGRVLRESAAHFDSSATVPLGAISYPLLRPPRASG